MASGILGGDVLKTFYGVTSDAVQDFKYIPGTEKIPDNWYKRAIGDEYTIPGYQLDLLSYAAQYPQILSFGGNTGKVNTFTPLDVGSLTKGLYNTGTLLEGSNFLCFALQVQQATAPDLLAGLFIDLESSLSKLKAAFDTVFEELGCRQFLGIDKTEYAKYPGAKVQNRAGEIPT